MMMMTEVTLIQRQSEVLILSTLAEESVIVKMVLIREIFAFNVNLQ